MCLVKKSYLPRFAWHSKAVYKVLWINCKGERQTPFFEAVAYPGTIIKCAVPFICGLFNKEITASGVHSFSDIFYAKRFQQANEYKMIVVRAEIPRFSWYWIGRVGEIASNKLKIIS